MSRSVASVLITQISRRNETS